MGGYSSRRKINQWMTGKDCLQKPLERIYFAGTETALEWRGYIEGALESGERQAYKVLSEFNKQQSDLTSPN
jgi:monoamine oxidase